MSPALKHATPRDRQRSSDDAPQRSAEDAAQLEAEPITRHEASVDPETTIAKVSRRSYQPTRRLGEGATASVWSARDEESGEEVVIKRYHSRLLHDEVARRRIEDEVAVAQRLSHPNIVPVIDSLVTNREAALVFPYVEGQTLAERLKSGAPLTSREAARTAVDVADALTAAHAMGIVHRDVKPSNILLGADGTARLLDFGISRSLEEGEDRELTGAGLAIGTLPYMAPEQLRAKPPAPATDVFALGVVLYEMLSGRRPFEAESPLALAEHQEIQPARIANAPPALVDLTLAAMALDPMSRPAAAQFARSARGWLDGRADAAAPTQAHVVPSSPRRRPPVIAAIGIGCLALAASAALAFSPGWLAPPADQAAPPAATSTPVAPPTVAPTPAPTVHDGEGQSAGDGDGKDRRNGDKNRRNNRGGDGDDDDDDDD